MNDPMLPINPKLLVKEERILWAAIRVFSQYPFSVATVRMIAKEAELPISAVMYHFKSKENLYEAVFDRIAPYHGDALEVFHHFCDGSAKSDREKAEKLIEELIDIGVEGFYNSDGKNWFMQILFFECLYPSPMFETLYKKHLKNDLEMFFGLIKTISGNDDHNNAMLTGIGIIGHLMSFRMLRGFTGKPVDNGTFSPVEKAEIKTRVVQNALLLIRASGEKTSAKE